MKNYQRSPLLIITLLIVTVSSNVLYLPKLLAESSEGTSIKFIPPPPPPDRSAAGDRGEAASRGCGATGDRVTALVPRYQQTIALNKEESIPITKIWGLTTAEYPTFWFLVPYERSTISSLEFVLQDESQQPSKTIYRNFLTKPETAGIVSVETSYHAPPLKVEPGERSPLYHWFFKVKVQCSPQQPAQLHFVEGWIERTNLDSELDIHLEQLSPLGKAALYAEKGIWYDAVTDLAKLRQLDPEVDNLDLLAQWESLLQSIDLETIADYPIIDCCEAVK